MLFSILALAFFLSSSVCDLRNACVAVNVSSSPCTVVLFINTHQSYGVETLKSMGEVTHASDWLKSTILFNIELKISTGLLLIRSSGSSAECGTTDVDYQRRAEMTPWFECAGLAFPTLTTHEHARSPLAILTLKRTPFWSVTSVREFDHVVGICQH